MQNHFDEPKLGIQEFDVSDPGQISRLQEFCDKCRELGIINNSSFENLKLTMFASPEAKLWVIRDESIPERPIVGTSGCHPLPEIEPGCYRLLFRGCILPRYRALGMSGLSKKHFNSFIFRFTIPLQIEWARTQGGTRFVISTNIDYEETKTSPTDRIFHLLEKQGLVRKIRSDFNLSFVRQNVRQNVWSVQVKLMEELGCKI